MIRVLVATDASLTGDALRRVLEAQDDLRVVGCAHTPGAVERLLPHCDVLLITPALQAGDVRELIEAVYRQHPGVKTLVAGTEDDPETIVGYLEAGAAGYVLGSEPVQRLVKKVRAAHRREVLLSPDVAAEVMARLVALSRDPDPQQEARRRLQHIPTLTRRQREVLKLMARGCTNEQIAAALTIGHGTAKNHVHHILQKLDVPTRDAAADVYRLHLQEEQPAARAA